MEPDNAFNEIFGKKPSTEQKTETQNSLEDTSAINPNRSLGFLGAVWQ